MKVLNIYHHNKQLPENSVYIGRENKPMGLAASPYANPFPVGRPPHHWTRDQSVDMYQAWLWKRLQEGTVREEDLLKNLEGRDLVCFCSPKRCHGDVLLRAVAWAAARRERGLSQAPVAPLPRRGHSV